MSGYNSDNSSTQLVPQVRHPAVDVTQKEAREMT